MKSRAFRLEDSDIELLKQLAEHRGESQSDAIRHAIRLASSAIQGAIRENGPDDQRPADQNRQQSAERDSQPATIPRDVYEDLRGQLQVKDDQIRSLSEALVAAQETARAAQALHAIDRRNDLLQEPDRDDGDPGAGEGGKRELTRWERFKAIFA